MDLAKLVAEINAGIVVNIYYGDLFKFTDKFHDVFT